VNQRLSDLQATCRATTYTLYGQCIGEAFANLNPDIYATFCCHQNASVRLFNEKIKTVPLFDAVIRQLECYKECQRLHFGDFMAKVWMLSLFY
jgi:hypothetical protein